MWAVASLLLLAIVALLAYLALRGRRRPERFASPSAPHDASTMRKLCNAQDVCASRKEIRPDECEVPRGDAIQCCAYDAAARTCKSKW